MLELGPFLKADLIEKFVAIRGNESVEEIETLLSRLEKLKEEYHVEDAKFDLIILSCRLELKLKTTPSFDEHCAAADGIFEYMEKEEWDWLEMEILIRAMRAIKNLSRGNYFYKKAIAISKSEGFVWERRYTIRFALAYNFSMSLLKMYYLKLFEDNCRDSIRHNFFHCVHLVTASNPRELGYITHVIAEIRRYLFRHGDVCFAREEIEGLRETIYEEYCEQIETEINHFLHAVPEQKELTLFKLHSSAAFKYFREEQGLSIKELSKILRIKERDLENIENNKITANVIILINASRYFGINLDEFVDAGESLVKGEEIEPVIELKSKISALDDKTFAIVRRMIERFAKMEKSRQDKEARKIVNIFRSKEKLEDLDSDSEEE